MANYSYIGYTDSVVNFSGSTVSLDAGYDFTTDRRIFAVEDAASGGTIGSGSNSHTDNGVIFDGDRFDDEDGDDTTQTGAVTSLDGGTTYDSGPMYLEQSYTLTATGESSVTLYRVEIEGTLVGYIASEPMVEGVTYNFTTSNVMPNNAPNTTDPTAIIDVPCFMAGTLIETPSGLVPIEALKIGDDVHRRDGATVQVRWIGRRSLVPRFHPNKQFYPIRITRGALGHGQPNRDLLVSANHRVVFEGPEVELVVGTSEALVAAKFLVGLPGIFIDKSVTEIVYVHLLFDKHEILWADGLACESLYPGDLALDACGQGAASEIYDIFPALRGSLVHEYGPLALTSLVKREAHVCCEMRAKQIASHTNIDMWETA